MVIQLESAETNVIILLHLSSQTIQALKRLGPPFFKPL